MDYVDFSLETGKKKSLSVLLVQLLYTVIIHLPLNSVLRFLDSCKKHLCVTQLHSHIYIYILTVSFLVLGKSCTPLANSMYLHVVSILFPSSCILLD